jgi:hypothetical protein
MSVAENIQTMQSFLGYFDPAEARHMAQGVGATRVDQVSTPRKQVAEEERSNRSVTENIQTVQTFLGHFNPAEAKRMAQGGGATRADHVSPPGDRVVGERSSGVSTAETVQTLQAFLGYFNPAQAKRMAQGGGVRLAAEGAQMGPASRPRDQVADERLLRRLSALQDALPDLDVAIQDTIAEGDKVAVRFAVASHQAGHDPASAPGILICRVAGGKIVEHWMQPDVPALLQVLGAVPTPART